MKETLIILGAGVMQGPAIRTAREMGLYTVAVDADDRAPCVPLADRFEKIDLKDKEGIAGLGLALQKEGPLGGVMTAGTDFSASAAWAAERLGLPGIPYEAALNASDKERMRRCFSEAGLPSPAFMILDAVPAADQPPAGLPGSYPLVVKPVDNMGARGCRQVRNSGELRRAVADALNFSRSRRAIVEAFMEGPEFSVDAIVYHGDITICGLADRHIFFPPYFIEMGHTMPTALPPEQQEALLETFRAGIRALGIAGEKSAGAAKGDIKLAPPGPMIGEIAARLSGGYMSGWTYPYASGVNPVRGAILAALGRKPEGLVPVRNWTSAERAFISIPGRVRSIKGREAAGDIPHVKDLFMRAEAGGTVKFPENNVTKCGNVISAAPGRDTAVEAAERAARSVLVRLEAPGRDTAEFLAAGAADSPGAGKTEKFPPDAFEAGPELRRLLDRLPPEKGRENTRVRPENLRILPFPEFQASGLRDYMGRTVEESLDAVRALTGISLPESPEKPAAGIPPAGVEDTTGAADNEVCLGRSFWAALIRGGYQGAAYIVDSLTGGGQP
ncbi:MAG: ATP-grasp domain-containing protein [Treponema sp.]|jgi:biotin carboxylase|nr:ATP-grasp domain-containing protein [Treponema sp.]